jgi:hypothetical protein
MISNNSFTMPANNYSNYCYDLNDIIWFEQEVRNYYFQTYFNAMIIAFFLGFVICLGAVMLYNKLISKEKGTENE